MKQNSAESFFERMRQRLLRWRVDREICYRLFPHLEREKDCGYPFATDEQLRAQIEALDLRPLLDTLEQQWPEMPEAYRESFRYIMYRDLHKRLSMYARLAQRHLPAKARIPHLWAQCV